MFDMQDLLLTIDNRNGWKKGKERQKGEEKERKEKEDGWESDTGDGCSSVSENL